MKKIIYLAVITSFSINATSQNAFTDSLKKHYINVYHQSFRYNDAKTAISALNGYIAMSNNEQVLPYKDTLSMLYFANKEFYSALLLSQEVVKQDPGNVNALARSGECFQTLGDAKSAVAALEQVCQKIKNPYYNYQLAVSQYQLKRITESESNLKIVLADTNSNRIAVAFPLPNGSVQEIPASAAALNVLGIIQLDAKNYEQAKKYFEQALQIYPDFVGARQNLQVLASAGDKKSTPKTNAPGKKKS
jgi:tetratricopeptide (TPR) repeat protein